MGARQFARYIGYWKGNQFEPPHIDPHLLVGKWEPELKAKVVAYLKAGKMYMGYMGWSTCRFCKCHNGALDLTDGDWIWPEGLAHYVETHDVMLPLDFVQCLEDKQFKMPEEPMLKDGSYEYWNAYCMFMGGGK